MPRTIKGFTLIEVLIGMALLAMLVLILYPKVWSYRENAVKTVCVTNRETVMRQYNIVNIQNNEDIELDQFILENFDGICPDHGKISYVEGKILCSIHNHTDVDDDKPDVEVPWLSSSRLTLMYKHNPRQ